MVSRTIAALTQTSTAMTSKRQRRDTSEREPTDTPDTQEAAVAAIRQLMRQFSLDPAMFKLEDDVSGLSLSLSCGLVC